MLDVFSFFFLSFFRHAFSEFPRPIALKLCHLIGICVYFRDVNFREFYFSIREFQNSRLLEQLTRHSGVDDALNA